MCKEEVWVKRAFESKSFLKLPTSNKKTPYIQHTHPEMVEGKSLKTIKKKKAELLFKSC